MSRPTWSAAASAGLMFMKMSIQCPPTTLFQAGEDSGLKARGEEGEVLRWAQDEAQDSSNWHRTSRSEITGRLQGHYFPKAMTFMIHVSSFSHANGGPPAN